ncbi:MAG: STAS domain-containing protein [Actinobacteria bacterium]|nr:STAS domain-containing protein [Actinomycetota bacterium]
MSGKENALLTVKTKETDGVHILCVNGECDMSTAFILKDALHSLIFPSAELPTKLVVDLRGLSYLDSSAFWVLAAVNRKITETGGELDLVVGTGQPILQAVKLLKMDRIMSVYSTIEEALCHLSIVDKKKNSAKNKPARRGARVR